MNFQLVYRYILSLSENEIMFLKNKTKRPRKKKNSFPGGESNPRPLTCEGYALSIATQQLTLMLNAKLIILNTFFPWNATGGRCLKLVDLYLRRIERYIRGFDGKSRTSTHFVAFEEHMADKRLGKPSPHLFLTALYQDLALYSLQFSAFTWRESITIQQH